MAGSFYQRRRAAEIIILWGKSQAHDRGAARGLTIGAGGGGEKWRKSGEFVVRFGVSGKSDDIKRPGVEARPFFHQDELTWGLSGKPQR